MRILVVEDEKGISDAVASKLIGAGYTVDVQADGEDGFFDARTGIYDLIILDIMLPGMNGLEILEKLRSEKVQSKIIMLTALATIKDKIVGLESGANDYLAKPFHMDELLARVNVQLRADVGQEVKLSYGDLGLDLEKASLSLGDRAIQLSAKELRLMELFLRNPGQIFNQDYIYGKIWGIDVDVESNSLEAYISFVRKKLRALDAKVKIVTLRGIGYKLVEEKNE